MLHLVGVYIIYINDARSNKYQIFTKYKTGLLEFVQYLIKQIAQFVNIRERRTPVDKTHKAEYLSRHYLFSIEEDVSNSEHYCQKTGWQ